MNTLFMPTTYIGAGDFKAKCLSLIDSVAETRDTLIISKQWMPVDDPSTA